MRIVTRFSNQVRSFSSESLPAGGVQKLLEKTGRFPPITLLVRPLQPRNVVQEQFILDRFLDYNFTSSVLVPVDNFSFNFVAPDDPRPVNKIIRSGDMALLAANGIALSTGIIDTVETEVEATSGERVAISGRDFMGQMEDQNAININDQPIWANNVTVSQGIQRLIENTRIKKLDLRNAPSGSYLLATEPGESKLSALQRLLEPLNIIAFMRGDGVMVVGRPRMGLKPKGTLILSKSRRESNVLSMKVTRTTTTVPNIIVPIWSGQEFTTDRVGASQRFNNGAEGPTRLRKLGHILVKTTVVSTPRGDSPQDLAGVNRIKAGGSNLLQAYAKRDLARANTREETVQAMVPGHYDENGQPWQTDTIYKIESDRLDIDKKMYLYQCDYSGSESEGQRTRLWFCNLGTIVSDIIAP